MIKKFIKKIIKVYENYKNNKKIKKYFSEKNEYYRRFF